MVFAENKHSADICACGVKLSFADAYAVDIVSYFSVFSSDAVAECQTVSPSLPAPGETFTVHSVEIQAVAALAVAANAVVRFAHLVLSVVTDKGAKIRSAISKFRRFRNRIPTRKIFAKTLFLRL